MKVLLDTSTLIAAMLPDHVHHIPAHAWLSHVINGELEFVVSGHSLAEVYSVLTRLPRTPRISSSEAWQMVDDNILSYAQTIVLTGNDYISLMAELSQQSLGGGLVYDAIIARSAALADVDLLVTLNPNHFQQVWPSGMNRIISPLLVTPPIKS